MYEQKWIDYNVTWKTNDVNSMIVNDLWAVSELWFGSFFSYQSLSRYCLWSLDHGFNWTRVRGLSCFIYAGQKVLARAFWQIWSQLRWNALVCTPWVRRNTIQEGTGHLLLGHGGVWTCFCNVTCDFGINVSKDHGVEWYFDPESPYPVVKQAK